MRGRKFGDRFRGKQKDRHVINEDIKASEVRLVGVETEQLGIVSLEEALRLAEEAGVDLVQVAADSDPPVCRLLDYGKLRYQEQKKAAEARKRTAAQGVKELRIGYRTEQHDLDTKVRKARAFLESGERVRFQMRFRGREIVYANLGRATLEKVAELLSDIAEVEEVTSVVGNRMLLTMVPKAAAK